VTARRPAVTWASSVATKFRAPRVRRDVIARDELVRRACAFAMDRRVTLVQAPAGAGKSTLMAQLVASGTGAVLVWLSLDEDDNNANRLFSSLLTALQNVELDWVADMQAVASQVTGPSEQSRAAVNLLVNSLCSFEGDRLLIVLDDLHRITDPGALKLLDDFIERVPPEVGVLIGTRVVPELSLARWRSRGELGELRMTDLQFDESDARALANARLAGAAPPELVRKALERTQGWVAGLHLMFGAVQTLRAAGAGAAERHTFDFLAHEVIADLPRELREFAVRCSVLPELSPVLCAAVSGSDDVRPFLDELYRRDLFLSAIDEVTPILRFHDLFREYLQRELEALVTPQELRELHARAARAESVPTRAIAHWLQAGMWDVAIEAIETCADALLAEGGQALVERWISQLPATHRQERPGVMRLQALCAWARYDFKLVRQLMAQACDSYRQQRDHRGLARTLPMVARVCNTTGDLAGCDQLVQECEMLELEPADRASLTAVRAWNALASGRGSEAVRSLQELADAAARDSSVLFPSVCDLFNGFFYDLPGGLAPMRALKALCIHAEQVRPVHWQVSALAHSSRPEFCAGDYSSATEALADRERFQQRHGTLPATWVDIHQLRALNLAASGCHAQAMAEHAKCIELIRHVGLAELREAWLRVLILDATRFAWAAEDSQAMRKLLAQLEAPRAPAEWPALETGIAYARGLCSLLEGRLEEAERDLVEAGRLFERTPHMLLLRQHRVGLAFLRLAQNNPRAAWETFAPVWKRALDEDAVGVLLIEPPARLAELLSLMPDALRREPATRILLERIASWKQAPERARARAEEVASTLAVLTDREREVLACIGAGDSNKLIARALDLSLHTVKRHVANILSKLNVSTRSAAASLYRSS
jgi:LuxR family maltose regulon positive regulatory protein